MCAALFGSAAARSRRAFTAYQLLQSVAWNRAPGVLAIEAGHPFVRLGTFRNWCSTICSTLLAGKVCVWALCGDGVIPTDTIAQQRSIWPMRAAPVQKRLDCQISAALSETEWFVNRQRYGKRSRRVVQAAPAPQQNSAIDGRPLRRC